MDFFKECEGRQTFIRPREGRWGLFMVEKIQIKIATLLFIKTKEKISIVITRIIFLKTLESCQRLEQQKCVKNKGKPAGVS